MNTRSPGELAAWQSLTIDPHRVLVDQVDLVLPRDGHPTPAMLDAWRQRAGPEIAAAAVELVRARRASAWKFRDAPGSPLRPARDVLLDLHAGEQASAWPIARHKAERFKQRLPESPLIDACCGVGADTRELVVAGLNVRAVDIDPLRTWMCAWNAGVTVEQGDAATLNVENAALHIDPARRTESRTGTRRRLRSPEHLLPPIAAVASLAAASAGACIKLGPGLDPDELLPLNVAASLEYVSLDGRLAQALWWTGPLADDRPIRATLLTDRGVMFTISGESGPLPEPSAPRDTPLGAHVYAVDPAIERAGLLRSLADDVGFALVHPALGLLTDDPDTSPLTHPALTPFDVHTQMPWRRDRVAAWLRDHDAGIVEVKTRAKVCDPDVEQAQLRSEGATPFCVFVLRFGDDVRAIITSRTLPDPAPGATTGPVTPASPVTPPTPPTPPTPK